MTGPRWVRCEGSGKHMTDDTCPHCGIGGSETWERAADGAYLVWKPHWRQDFVIQPEGNDRG